MSRNYRQCPQTPCEKQHQGTRTTLDSQVKLTPYVRVDAATCSPDESILSDMALRWSLIDKCTYRL
jgi:hypothetical protein